MRVFKILFLFFLLIYPFAELTRISFYDSAAVTLNDAVLGVVISVWFFYIIAKRNFKKICSDKMFFTIMVFPAICLISLFVNLPKLLPNEFFVSISYLVRWFLYASLYLIVRRFDTSFKKKVMISMVIAGTGIVVGGYIQYFFYPSLRNLYYAGWDEHLYRIFSSFLDPNYAGAFFVLLFLLVAPFFLQNFIKKNITKALFFGLLELSILIAVFLTYSRSAFIMLFVSVFFFLIMFKKKRVFLLFTLFSLAIFLFLPRLSQTEGTNIFRVTSSLARVTSAQHAIQIFIDNPIIGVGFNAYRYAQFRYGFLNHSDWLTSHSGAGAENSFLFILATTGILGFASYLYFWFALYRYEWNLFIKVKNMDKFFPAVVLASFVGLFINSFFINSLFYPLFMEWMWILLGLTENT